MLSYLHAFHAGNFADVQKHGALLLALRMMQAKDSAIACFDTHAGSALYRLDSDQAQKTDEARRGIQALWPDRQQLLSGDWKAFMAQLERFNGSRAALSHYGGSPAWMAALKRPQDTVTAFELHPTETGKLSDWAATVGIQVRHQDGLRGLLKALPPSAPRLLVLTDPSYEIKTEYRDVAETVIKAWQRCRHGVFLVWYPILPKQDHHRLFSALTASEVTKVLRSELTLAETPDRGMSGSGMLVINPPWGFEERFRAMMSEAGTADRLNATHQLDWLVPE
ncbi:23S rRNA (adenine(2030)-N(6))-methyltransferase RlmJ [Marinobacter caseinilyticus]|uniref:23S rRNA (adenine(2030)-N(6))-methyltransferase RlmJ n=1 Tax=Marinobacter caseinilyticus TaxID=2692195 RepID=UPI00140C6D16|nr:23S rRNA (adenine(2030)-N(6))-methyltransferase RlmJ [Marinobacter caseinilyticus]